MGRIWIPCPKSSLVPGLGATCRLSGNRVISVIGTSFAAPHVAGLAALLVEKLGRNPGAIRDAIFATADDLGAAGIDPLYGNGRINVARALGLQ